jgi:hypothetical protein
VSQYLTILGTLALQLHDAGQAREILKSSLTLAKTLYDIPTQMWVLSVFTGIYFFCECIYMYIVDAMWISSKKQYI